MKHIKCILMNIKMCCQKNCNYTEVQNFLLENTFIVHLKKKKKGYELNIDTGFYFEVCQKMILYI